MKPVPDRYTRPAPKRPLRRDDPETRKRAERRAAIVRAAAKRKGATRGKTP